MTKENLKIATDLLADIEEIGGEDGILYNLKDRMMYPTLMIKGRCDDGVSDYITEMPDDLRALVIGYYEDKLAKLEAEFKSM